MSMQVPESSVLASVATPDMNGILSNMLEGIRAAAAKLGVYDAVSAIADTVLNALPSPLWLVVFVVTALLPLAFLVRAVRYLGSSAWRSALQVLFAVISGLVALMVFKALPAGIPSLHIELGLWVALLSSLVIGLGIPLIAPKAPTQGQVGRVEPKVPGSKGDHPMV